jgi:glucosamine--fructose-6-phosphate aminotransferase (isomerizing)
MEASLKLKEVSYIFSEAYAAGELKHGTIALIEPGTLVVVTLTQQRLADKTLSNVREVKARGARVLLIASEALAEKAAPEADEIWLVPDTKDMFLPLLAIIPLQLLAYYMAVERGCDVDKPRNLAKSVTVE